MKLIRTIGLLAVFLGLTRALLAAEEPTVADLAKILEDPSAKVEAKREACAKLARMETAAKAATGSVIKMAISDDPRLRAAGIETLGWIAEDLERVVPILIQGLKDVEPAIGYKAAVALSQLGLDVIPQLMKAAKNDDALVRGGALRSLGMFGGEAPKAIALALEALRDDDRAVRGRAESFLRLSIPADSDTIKSLITMVEEDDNSKAALERKTRALWLLVDFRNASKTGLTAFRRQLQAEDRELSLAAARLLARLGEEREAVKPILHRGLKEGAENSRILAAEALLDAGEAVEEVLPMLLEVLENTEDRVRFYLAVRVVRRIGSSAVPSLVKQLENRSCRYRLQIPQILAGMGKEAKAATPALLRLTKDTDKGLAAAIFEILPAVAEPTKEAVEAIENGLENDSKEVRKMAAISLPLYEAEAATAVPALLRDLNANPADDRISLLTALAGLGPIAKEAKQSLEKFMETAEDNERAIAALALLRIDKTHKRALELLRQSLKDDKAKSRSLICMAMLREDAVDVRHEIVELLGDPESAIRMSAALALWHIGLDKQSALALCDGTHDSHVLVRQCTALALGRAPTNSRDFVVSALEILLKDRSSDVRMAAAVALLQLDAANKGAKNRLQECCYRYIIDFDESRYMGRATHFTKALSHEIEIVGMVGADASALVPALTRVTQRANDPAMRDAAEKALKKITADK